MAMAKDPLAKVRTEVGLRVAEIRNASLRLSPLDLHARMDAIRQLAATNGLAALEGLARHSAQLALLPGCRVTMQSCLEHVEEALDSHCDGDRTAILAIAEERVDPVLLYMSRDYVGDMAETVALFWPAQPGEPPEIDDATIRISDAIERLRSASRMDAPRVLAAMLDHLDASGRFALLKLATGALRVGVSARLAKQAFADAFALDVDAVEEVWHGLKPPYNELFDWARSEE